MSSPAPISPQAAVADWLHKQHDAGASHPTRMAEVGLVVNPLVDAATLQGCLRGKYKRAHWPLWRQAVLFADRADLIDAMAALGHRWSLDDLHAALASSRRATQCVRHLLTRPGVLVIEPWSPPPAPARDNDNAYHDTPAQSLLARSIGHPCWKEILAIPEARHQDALDETAMSVASRLLPNRHHNGWLDELQQLVALGASLHRAMNPWSDSLRPVRHNSREFGGGWVAETTPLPQRTAYSVMVENIIERPPEKNESLSEGVLDLVRQGAHEAHPWVMLDALGRLSDNYCRLPPPAAKALVQAMCPGLLRRHPEWGCVASLALASALLRTQDSATMWPMSCMRGADPWDESDIHQFVRTMLPIILNPSSQIAVSRLGNRDQWLNAPFIPADLQPLWERASHMLRGAGQHRLRNHAARRSKVEELLLQWSLPSPAPARPKARL